MNLLEQLTAQKLGPLVGFGQQTQQPQTVVNNYIPGANGVPAVGDAMAADELYQGFGESELEDFGDEIDFEIVEDDYAYGDPELDAIGDEIEQVARYVYGSTEVPRDVSDRVGGVRDRYNSWRRRRGRATNRDLTGKQATHSGAIKSLQKDLNMQRKINARQGRSIRKLNTRLKGMEAVAGNDTMDIFYRELRQLPGLRAFSLTTSEQMIDYVGAVGDALDHNLKPATLAGAATVAAPTTPAEAQAVAIDEIDKVRAAVAELIQNQTAILDSLSKAAVGTKAADLLEILKDNSLHQLAVLLPEQYTDTEKALISSGVRYVGGTVPTTEGRSFFGMKY